MSTYIILLRAVNVGGHGKLSMSDFRNALSGLGFDKIETYIQSGNAVVETKAAAAKVARSVSTALEMLTGSPVGVLVRTHDQLDRLIRENPFAKEAQDGTKVHVAFLAGPASPGARAVLERIVQQYPARRDRFHISGDHIYFHLPDGTAGTKLTGKTVDKAIGVIGTGRNWNTVLKLHAMSKR